MTKTKRLLATFLAVSAAVAIPTAARAADHGDAPTLAQDQGADIADVFFFLDPNDNEKVVVIATVHGFIVPGEAVNFAIFDPVLRYRLEFENTGDAQADRFIDVTFSPRTGGVDPNVHQGEEALQIPFAQTATVKIGKLTGFSGGTFKNLPVLNPNLGAAPNTPTSTPLLKDGVDTGISFFAGEVDDPFFFDIPGFSRFIASIRTTGTPDVSKLNRGRDSFGGYNILAIALSMPKSYLKKNIDTVGVRFLTQRRTFQTPTKQGTVAAEGEFRTVDSMGNPAVNVVLIPFSHKNKYNAFEPSNATPNKFAGDIVATLNALGLPTNDPNLAALAEVAVNHGDYLRLDFSKPNTPMDKVGGGDPTAPNGFPNGRRLRDDTVDILLNIITKGGITMGDHTNSSISQFPQTSTFPFLAPAQQPVDSVDPNNPTATDDKTQN